MNGFCCFELFFPFPFRFVGVFCANHIDSRNHQHQRRPGPDTFTPAMMIYGHNQWKNIMNLFITLLRGRRKMYRFFMFFVFCWFLLPRLKAERFWVPTHAHVNESRKANGEQYSDIKIEDTKCGVQEIFMTTLVDIYWNGIVREGWTWTRWFISSWMRCYRRDELWMKCDYSFIHCLIGKMDFDELVYSWAGWMEGVGRGRQ